MQVVLDALTRIYTSNQWPEQHQMSDNALKCATYLVPPRFEPWNHAAAIPATTCTSEELHDAPFKPENGAQRIWQIVASNHCLFH